MSEWLDQKKKRKEESNWISSFGMKPIGWDRDGGRFIERLKYGDCRVLGTALTLKLNTRLRQNKKKREYDPM